MGFFFHYNGTVTITKHMLVHSSCIGFIQEDKFPAPLKYLENAYIKSQEYIDNYEIQKTRG